MTAETITELDERRTSRDDDDLNHIVECHNDNRGLCGVDLTEARWNTDPDPDEECIVCNDLEPIHCGCDCGCCDGDPE